MEIWIPTTLLAAFFLIYFQATGLAWILAIALRIALGYVGGIASVALTAILATIVLVPASVLAIKPLRRAFISPHILDFFKRILPRISQTEKDALEAGSTWWESDLFSGAPDWEKLLSFPAPRLTVEEQAFLDSEVGQLCDMVDDWETTHSWQDLSPAAWQFIKEKGFLGMIIPKKYGGKEFSAYMHSQVVMKLSSRCSALAVSVMVPNSLGPAELLLHYGTDEQKAYYLPRLAVGVELPCFALTSPYAGSDAAAIPDIGVVCNANFEGKQTLGLRITWSKRYITLGPIATVLGLAFQTVDPDHLIGTEINLGISCALIPTKHAGVVIGRRHWPLNAVFQNGPTSGTDVFIPIAWLIGGQSQVGKGWRMLMECLAAGRAISLPSTNVGMAKLAVRGTSAYSAVRRQFNTAIGKFEGVQEALSRMGGNLYMMDAARKLSAVAVDLGEKPAVVSAIVKYHVTERARAVVNDGMDILGGKGICMGPKNFLARAYQQIPIAITVEGANILTRCLIIFGQGAIRSHPYVLHEMQASLEDDPSKAVGDFDRAFFGHVGFVLSNLARSIVFSMTAARLVPVPRRAAKEMRAYYRAVGRLSALFACLTDLSMLLMGGTLKRRERISARLGDVLSQMYLICAVLKRYEDDGRPVDDTPYALWSIQDALVKAQQAVEGVLDNFPNRPIAWLVRAMAFPFGLPYRQPSDTLATQVAQSMQCAGDSRSRLLADSFVPHHFGDPICCGERALALLPQIDAIETRLKPSIQSGSVEPIPQSQAAMRTWIADAVRVGLINVVEKRAMSNFVRFSDALIQVDDFPPDYFSGHLTVDEWAH